MSRLSVALIAAGLCAISFGVLWQLGLWPGSQVSLPPPVAFEALPPTLTPAPTFTIQATPTTRVVPTAIPTAVSTPTPVPLPTPVPIPVVVADAADRQPREPLHATGYAVRLAIASINLDTQVVQGGILLDSRGHAEWQTLPFVAVHYGDLTSLLGAPGNAVISGHVVTINEGNVFRKLYQVALDDEVQVWDEHEREYDYHVVDVKLVSPSDVSVMAPTEDQTLTLITCGGTFDRIRSQFSQRLIVTASRS
jgi:LPXTG-site transpeptidase (sortase) family protein